MPCLPYSRQTALIAVIALAVGGCSANGGTSPANAVPAAGLRQMQAFRPGIKRLSTGAIQHVVIIFQENRSFDNLFQGFPGADTRSYGYASDGTKVTLQPIGLETTWDVEHDSGGFFAACDGQGPIPGTRCKMDGFDQEGAGCSSCPPYPQYAYVPQSETKLYFEMAQKYVLGDRTFPSNFDASSFISHQYIIRAAASSAVDYPGSTWGCDGGSSDTVGTVTRQPPRQYGPSIVACFDDKTLGDELDDAQLSWKYYATSLSSSDGSEIWSAYQAIRHIRYGPDWSTHVVSPQTRFFRDLHAGNLPAVSWVTPTCAHSDHAGCGSNTGPKWVAALVNAIGNSQYWNSTAIFVMWDDYGGWYDHVPPPYAGYDGLGMRVPLLVISPYAKQGYVSHVQYEHGSILKFIEDQFGLPRLSASDRRAISPEADCFDFSQPPRAFTPFKASPGEAEFLREPEDHRPPDDQ